MVGENSRDFFVVYYYRKLSDSRSEKYHETVGRVFADLGLQWKGYCIGDGEKEPYDSNGIRSADVTEIIEKYNGTTRILRLFGIRTEAVLREELVDFIKGSKDVKDRVAG